MEESLNIDCIDCNNYAQRRWIQIITDKILGFVHAIFIDTKKDIKKFGLGKFLGQFTKLTHWRKLGFDCINKYENVVCPNPEHAIILINPDTSFKKGYVYSSGIDLLIDYFEEKLIKFKLYNCHTCEEFYKSLTETPAQKLWLIGHGDRHGVSFGRGKGKYCPFCKDKNKYSDDKTVKPFIAQLHCCHGEGKTLYEYLSDKPGIFSKGTRSILQNREEISKWIEDNKKNEIAENI